MKTALVTTTIYVPKVLARYRALDPAVRIFVAGDRKTPHAETRAFVEALDNAVYLSDTDQERLGGRVSEIVGWNKIMRRNLALLEAIRWGAELVISIDDDNLPIDGEYFADFRRVLGQPWSGLLASSPQGWYNFGELVDPPIHPRGFPYDRRKVDLAPRLRSVEDARIGVAAGLWLGDPDIDALDRIATRPAVRGFSDVLRAGLAIGDGSFTPINSQNTAYLGELAPLLLVLVGIGRYDDIWGSYIAQRVMLETGHLVHVGRPFVWQERNPHNPWTNLKDEIFGMENTTRFCRDLLALKLGSGAPLELLARLYEGIAGLDYVPPVVAELGREWCAEIERSRPR